jgi:CxxC-x17-CxxC domain-containing protein
MFAMLWKRPRLNNRLDATTRTPLSTDAEIPEGTAPADQQESFPLYNDKNLTCADCGQEFVFTASEQDFYSQRGFSEPRRCASCRASRKAARGDSGGSGGGYSSGGGSSYGGGYSSGAGSYGSSSGGGGSYDRGPREMFTATCSSCGKEASVPFRPTSGKPVYCSDCFRSQRG